MRMKRYGKGHLAGLLIFGMALPDAAQAAQTTTTFPVTATVLTACAVTANPLSFGNYDPTSATPLDATTTLSVLCTVGTSFTVGLNAGTSSGATVTSRKMVNGANLLNYGLFRETTRTNNWGNTPGTDTPPATTAPVLPSTLTVYGRIPPSQNVPAGGYADTVTVTVNY
ncbi:spore coat protein [Sphingobium sp. 22B]|nr:spore coat protein [Sphingobium sp. AM]KYC33431.1 spore coat protein [Sphingobium sp. 22B]OAP32614.1 spore coat protein [Sphingobium sp. 20006FA]PNQ03132.1 spore coat protein [Sphingobium sp. SA916]QDC37675.1 spore coat protein U domain-containing protein [Sphingobium fuliginis ATCC 27551]RYM00722.1 SCPU domain-containing protein [Sphingobium fuliginis]